MLKKAASQPPVPQILLIGPSRDGAMHAVEAFLHRNQISFESLEPGDPALTARIGASATVAGPYPVAQLPDGTRLVAPTMRAIATMCGLQVAPARTYYDVMIVGGGPAGLTAAVNAASEGLRTGSRRGFRPGRAGGDVDTYRELPGISIRRIRRRSREQHAQAGEAAGGRNRRDADGSPASIRSP